jgi:hypothetical protein
MAESALLKHAGEIREGDDAAGKQQVQDGKHE